MRKGFHVVAAGALAVLAALPAAAKTDPKSKNDPVLRYQHTYAQAIEEAKQRGCVIFATFHIDH